MFAQTKVTDYLVSAQRPQQKFHEEETNIGNESRSKESAYSFPQDTDGDNKRAVIDKDLHMEYEKKRPNEINIWRHRNTSNPDFNGIDEVDPKPILNNSLKSCTSGMTYDAIDIFPKAEPRQVQERKKRKSSTKCRVIKIATVIFVLLVLGLIAYLIVNNLTNKVTCEELFTVENGTVRMSDDSKTVVDCNEGYGPQESLTIKCKNGKWSTLQPCPLIDCGTYPTVSKGIIDGVGTTFGFTASLQCDPGFMINASTTFTCLANGTWSSNIEPLCIPHPCGVYNVTANVLVRDDFSHINMTVDTKCEEGFDFADGSDTFIFCENGSWKNNPRCEVPGNLSLETQNSSVLIFGRPFSVSCRLTDSPDWETVFLTRADSNISEQNPLIIATRYADGSITTDPLDDALNLDREVLPLDNGVKVTATFNQVQCSDAGLYICGVLDGNTKESKGNKTTRRKFNVIDVSSNVENISAQTTLTQGDEMTIRCTGKLGMDQNRRKLAEMSIKIVYKNESTAERISSYIESSILKDCQLEETLNSTIVVRNRMQGAELLCVLESSNGSKQKQSVLLNVSETTVQISASSSSVYIGDSLNISTELKNIRGWESLEIRKECSDEPVFVARHVNINENISSSTVDGHIVVSDISVSDTSAKIILHFNRSTCSDACWKGGEIVYVSAVKIEDSWVDESMKIEFQVKPNTPRLTTEHNKFYREQEAEITCTGNVGIPGREIHMKENSKTIPARQVDAETQIDEETCANIATLRYSFTITDETDGYNFSCETSTENGTMTSNILTINVSDPILYFTDDSMVGQIGSSKMIQCVLTSTANLTNVVISRHSSEEKLCEVTISENDISESCSNTEIMSVEGSFSQNRSVFTTDVLMNVSCESEGLYVCRSNTEKTKMNFKVTRNVTRPYLELPKTLVEKQATEWEDVLFCTADLGYPLAERTLEIQIKLKDSSTFQIFSSNAKAKDCKQKALISEKQITLDESHNGSTVRCVILDKDKTVIESSLEENILLLKNVCVDDSTGDYDPHPYNCRRYIRCVGKRLYDQKCAEGSCAATDSDPICNDDCRNC